MSLQIAPINYLILPKPFFFAKETAKQSKVGLEGGKCKEEKKAFFFLNPVLKASFHETSKQKCCPLITTLIPKHYFGLTKPDAPDVNLKTHFSKWSQ